VRYKIIHKKDGTEIHRPRLIDKYWHRVKMYFKKEHIDYCQCYWCLKERFRTNINCPQCKKHELKSAGYHRNYGIRHESGTIVYCKCGYKKDLNEEMNKILRELDKGWLL
jgi:hypothetical protein